MRKYFYMIGISFIFILVGLVLMNPDNAMKTINTKSITRSLKSNTVNTISIKPMLMLSHFTFAKSIPDNSEIYEFDDRRTELCLFFFRTT